jgi:hypothetical protein
VFLPICILETIQKLGFSVPSVRLSDLKMTIGVLKMGKQPLFSVKNRFRMWFFTAILKFWRQDPLNPITGTEGHYQKNRLDMKSAI